MVTAVRLRMPSSQLMMPLAFAAHAGSMLALTGSPVNVIVSEAADDAGGGEFGFFEFTIVGVPLLLGTIVIVVLLGGRLLPTRSPKVIPQDFSGQARTLLLHYQLDDVARPGVAATARPVSPRSSSRPARA